MEEPNKPNKPPLNDYAKYSGIGFQMIAIILASVFLGMKLDKWLALKFPIFTLLLTLLGVAIAMYVIIREFLNKK